MKFFKGACYNLTVARVFSRKGVFMQRMKVSEIPYERADAEKVCGVIDKSG
ncbi:MAG: hypothetical protein L6V82_05710 [Clostridiales bacterium]|nr:MAG: hypothetical protein L6V82_05710 [Clostridiales bacterium]